MPLTSLPMRADTWMDGIAAAGQDLRLEQVGAFLTGASPSGSTGIAARPGVRYGTGDPLKIAASSGMTLAVNAGIAWVQGTAAATAGIYTGCLDTAGTVTLATSDPTNPRIDNIIVQVIDNGDNTSTTKVTPQTGTPASSPVAPTLPANSLLLATVAVAASTSSIVAGNITDKRVWTTSVGGIVPMKDVTGGISGMAGLYAHDLSTGRLRVSDGSGNAVTVKTAPFSPVTSSTGTSVTFPISNTNTVILNHSVTTDGITPIEIQASWFGVQQNPAAMNDRVTFAIWIDGAVAGSDSSWQWVQTVSSPGLASGGGIFRWIGTPSAGTHAVSWVGNANGSANPVVLQCSASQARLWTRALSA
jgi:hypothetical protein